LPDDAFVIAFGAESMTNVRKGMRQLLAALARLTERRGIVGLFFGAGELPSTDPALPPLRTVGYLSTAQQQTNVYSAADVFVIPSLEENLGQTGVEAIACGTPLVGFNTGGIPDCVRNGQTGMLAKAGDVDDLSRQIQWLIDRPEETRRMGRQSRQIAVEEFDERLCVERYSALYRQIAGDAAPKRRAA
jgi:glycosyltransferase involved in cell wall biosynthesis